MPLLNHRRAIQERNIPFTAMQQAADTPIAYDPKTCLCGARLPVQVRLGLRSRTRPVVEGRWACSDRCLQARVSSLIRRGLPQARVPQVHRHRVPLGLLLLQSGSISHEQLMRALTTARNTHDRIGQVLVREYALSEQALAAALAQQWGCGSWDVSGLRTRSAVCFAPRSIMERTGMLPVCELADGQLGIAFADTLDAQAIFAMQRIHRRPVEAGIAPASQFAEAMDKVNSASGVFLTELTCSTHRELVREMVRALERLQPVESRIVRVHNIIWMRMWLESSALLGGVSRTEDVVDLTVHLSPGETLSTES